MDLLHLLITFTFLLLLSIPQLLLILKSTIFLQDHLESELAVIQFIYSILIAFWGLSNVSWLLLLGVLDTLHQVLLFASGTIALFLAQVLITMIIYDRPIFNIRVRILAKIAGAILILVIGLILTQLLQWDDTLFQIVMTNSGKFHVRFHPPAALFLVLGEVGFFASVYLTQKRRRILLSQLKETVTLQELRYMQVTTISGLIIYLFGLSWIPSNISYIPDGLIYLGITLATVGVLLSIKVSKEDPFLHLHDSKHLRKLLAEGLIGWLVVKFGDLGPEIYLISQPLRKREGFTQDELINEAIGMITIPGRGDTYRLTSYIIPFGSQTRHVAICRSSFLIDPTLKDPRMKKETYAIYAIVLPINFTLLLKSFGEIKKVLDEELGQIHSLADIDDISVLNQINCRILSKIFQ